VIFVETHDADLLSAAEIDRAFEVAKNTGGWSFEEAELMARALVQTAGNTIVRVRAEQRQESELS
jgi:hypothetical protein